MYTVIAFLDGLPTGTPYGTAQDALDALRMAQLSGRYVEVYDPSGERISPWRLEQLAIAEQRKG